jgi:uncharacterized protein YxeA
MKKIIILLAALILLTGCGVTYYSYCEVDNVDMASAVSKQDAEWARNRKSPTRVVAVYPDSTGKTVYLMESRIREK